MRMRTRNIMERVWLYDWCSQFLPKRTMDGMTVSIMLGVHKDPQDGTPLTQLCMAQWCTI